MSIFQSLMGGKKQKNQLSEDDGASLLQNDELAMSYAEDQVGADAMAHEDPLSDRVNAMKTSGRQARAAGQDLGRSRTGEVLSAAQGAAVSGLAIGLDVAAPGLGYAVGAGRSVAEIRQRGKDGGNMLGETFAQGVGVATSFIPVVGNFLSFAEDLYSVGKTVLTSDKARTGAKESEARRMITDGNAQLTKLPALRAELNGYDGDDKDVLAERLDKAEQRLRQSIEDAEAWLAKKAEHGTLPLLSSDMSSSADEDEG